MKSDHRIEEENASPADDGGDNGSRGFLIAGGLRLIDGVVGRLQRLRDRIAPPTEAEDPWHGGKKAAARDDDTPPTAASLQKPHRLRSFLLVVATLLAGGLLGMEFSYSALSKIIRSQDLLIDDLRDEMAQYRKQETRNLNAAARYQKKIEENDMEIEGYQQEIAAYQKQLEELRAQLSAASASTRPNPVQTHGGGATRYKRPTRDKTGTCVMGGADSAASLAQCVEQFNR